MDLSRDLRWGALIALLFACDCASTPAPRALPPSALATTLMGSDRAEHALVDPNQKLTVVEFFSSHCPCQTEHDERLLALVSSYTSRGVAFVAVDSERGATVDRDRAEADRRGYRHPILIDDHGSVAHALQADYATFTLLLDRSGTILYSGGIDSDRTHLTSDATFYLRDAIDDALAEKAVRRPNAKTLGCSLELP